MNVLLLRLEAPLMSFGGVAVDALGVIDPMPSASLLTGLLGNALGYDRTDSEKLQSLQDRLCYAVRIDRPGVSITDYQTAELAKDDTGWTTHGQPEGRSGGAGSYEGQHQRFRDFQADAAVTVALSLEPANGIPDLETLARALERPQRPLFIGRKPCLPSGPLLLGIIEADDLEVALAGAQLADDAAPPLRAFVLDARRSVAPGTHTIHGLRNWHSDVHEGHEQWREIQVGASS